MNLGGAELLILVAVAVLLFGAGWLPKAARNLGKAKVEMDKAQQQFNEAKNTVVEAAGVKELESTLNKANKALNTSPQKLIKDAAKSAATGGTAAKATDRASSNDGDDGDDGIEDAEIVEESAQRGTDAVNVTVDFDET